MGARQGILNEIIALKPKKKWARRSTEVVQSIFKVVSGRVQTRTENKPDIVDPKSLSPET